MENVSKRIKKNAKIRKSILENAIDVLNVKSGNKKITKENLINLDEPDCVLFNDGNGNYSLIGFTTDIRFKSLVI